jgi:hypothetical protein
MRERSRKMATVVKLHCKNEKKGRKIEGGQFKRASVA